MTSFLIYNIAAICEQSSHCGMGQLFGWNCKSSAGNPRGMNLQMCSNTSIVSHFIDHFHKAPCTHIDRIKRLFHNQYISNCETEHFNRQILYPLQQEKLKPRLPKKYASYERQIAYSTLPDPEK